MGNMKVFNHTEFGELGVLIMGGKEYFPASKCASILGYTNPRDAVSRHCRGVVKHDIIDNLARKQEMNFIPEGDLYRLIIRSNLPKAEQFERWVFDEVLPSIRKYGLYATDTLLDDIINNPDLGIRLFTEYKEAKERAKKLALENAKHKQIIGELQPKASYYDLICKTNQPCPSLKLPSYGMSGRAMISCFTSWGTVQNGPPGFYIKIRRPGLYQSRPIPSMRKKASCIPTGRKRGACFYTTC